MAQKIQYLLNEVEFVETLTNVKEQATDSNTMQHRHDVEVYQSQLKKNCCESFTMLSSMDNDIIEEFGQYPTAQEM